MNEYNVTITLTDGETIQTTTKGMSEADALERACIGIAQLRQGTGFVTAKCGLRHVGIRADAIKTITIVEGL